jgi:hypothetical protein
MCGSASPAPKPNAASHSPIRWRRRGGHQHQPTPVSLTGTNPRSYTRERVEWLRQQDERFPPAGVAARLAVAVAIGATTAADVVNNPGITIGVVLAMVATLIWVCWAVQRFRRIRSPHRQHAGSQGPRTS